MTAEHVMPNSQNSERAAVVPAGESSLDRAAKWTSTIGAVSCGLLIVATVAVTIWGFTIRGGDTGGAMGVGLAFFVFLPLLAIPVGLVCLAGAGLSRVVLQRHDARAAKRGLWISLLAPLAVLAIYGLCFGLLATAS
jgi:hypothetical protein